jgi:membrane protease YdiL (CAAX protease family)
LTGQPAPPGRPPLLRAVIGILAYGLLGYSLAQIVAILLFGAMAWAGGSLAAWSRDEITGTMFLAGIAMGLGFFCSNRFVGSRVFGFTPVDLRWKGTGRPVRGAVIGFAAGLFLAGAVMGLGAVAGGAAWTPDEGTATDYIGRVGLLFVMLLPAAWAEEIIFRGLPIVVLDRRFGRGIAVGVTGLMFALAHSNNDAVTTLSIGNLCVAGVLLGVVFFAPGGIWTATGLHLGWNWALTALDAPVSGTSLNIPLLDYLPGRTTWLTGGAFGPEGGILATAVLGAATIVAARLFLGPHAVEADDAPR